MLIMLLDNALAMNFVLSLAREKQKIIIIDQILIQIHAFISQSIFNQCISTLLTPTWFYFLDFYIKREVMWQHRLPMNFDFCTTVCQHWRGSDVAIQVGHESRFGFDERKTKNNNCHGMSTFINYQILI